MVNVVFVGKTSMVATGTLLTVGFRFLNTKISLKKSNFFLL